MTSILGKLSSANGHFCEYVGGSFFGGFVDISSDCGPENIDSINCETGDEKVDT